MKKDPIIQEIRKIRASMDKQAKGDIHKFYLNLSSGNKPIATKRSLT